MFCDNDVTDPDTLHNKEAPNEQNAMCEERSAWEVMREHSDFKDGQWRTRNEDSTLQCLFLYLSRLSFHITRTYKCVRYPVVHDLVNPDMGENL